MREILFRGKNRDGVWLYGDLRQNANAIDTDGIDLGGDIFINPHKSDELYSPDYYAVSPDTVGQFTGLLDCNGTRIFEGDIVSFSAEEYFKSDGRLAAVDRHGEIVFCEGAFMILSGSSYFALSNSAVKAYDLIVCGNVHDNPSLLTA